MHLSTRLLRVTFAAAALTCLCAVSASAASLGVGTVNADALRLRDTAGTDATILATAAKGDAVIILEDAGNNWYKVDFKSVQGYMSGEYLAISQKADVTIGYGKVNTDGATLNMRSAPSTDASKVTALKSGDVVKIVGVDNGWYKVSYNGKTGYVSSDYMVTVKDSAGSRGDSTVAAPDSSTAEQLISYAKQFLGTPYVWGGNGPNSFDCSGYTKYIFSHFGYTLNRTATDQLSNGTAVSKSELKPGDLVFFKNSTTSKPVSHVGIYIGNSKFIHASTNTYAVEIDDMSSGYYSRAYVYGRRVL